MESELERVLEENAEFQASVDAFRKQVNERMETLRAQIRAVDSAPTSSIGIVEE